MRQSDVIFTAGQSSAELSKTNGAVAAGLLALLAGITMLFAAFTSAYIVRRGLSNDWIPLPFTGVLLVTPLLLLVSSACLAIGQRKFMQGVFRNYCFGAILSGGLFVLAQWYVWRQFIDSGVRVATHPAAAFYYTFTIAFSAFLVGGMIALLVVVRKEVPQLSAKPSRPARSVLCYWYYLSALWLYLFSLLYFWR